MAFISSFKAQFVACEGVCSFPHIQGIIPVAVTVLGPVNVDK